MSGYVLVVTDSEQASKLTALFRAEETTTLPLEDGRTLVYVTNSGAISDGVIFQGYGIDHHAERMTFAGASSGRTPDAATPLEGSYFTARIGAQQIRCGADVYGFVPMVWTSGQTLTAVSDSYLTLIAMRRSLGLPCTPDEETIRGRMWLNSMSLQQLGRETYCREIRYATPGTELRIGLSSGSVEERPLNLVDYYTGGFDSHADAVTVAASRMVRTFKTYAETGGLTTLGLSGGTDSRVCLAAALAADMDESLHVATRNNGSADYPIAVSLSERFGFPLNKQDPRVRGTVEKIDDAASWAGTSIGLYDALYTPPGFSRRELPVFSVGGQGAEISKGNFGWRPVTDIGMPTEGMDQSLRALKVIGADPDDRWGSEWHYLAFRNAIHGGRATLSSEYVARPAAQIPLIGLSRSALNDLPAPRKGAPSIVLDMLIKLSPELASLPFDDQRKNASAEYIAARLDRVGGPLDYAALSPYAIAGSGRSSHGILGSHLDIAKAAGFTGNLDPTSLMPRVDVPFRHFHELVPEVVRGWLDAINPSSVKRFGAAAREAGAVGKLLGLTTVM
ncbi:hypothetical protein [Agrococcus baldri]|uniref:Asparagine synthase n=1 Tax=Agrococcus baldri TaxID=153730 RepID=A0AA87URM2_9MICO|nr:hypothetical protein [Agrococcus baldri]GEK79694.1 hypothetical protein ABA31_10450 [Agrococcus baldri]